MGAPVKKRGRQSAAALADAAVLIGHDRPRITSLEPLTDEQAVVFCEMIEALPGTFFSQEQAPLVAQLCRHIVSARRLSRWIDRLERLDGDEFVPSEYLRSLESRRKETAAICALSRALRLTNQSRYRPESAARRAEDGDPSRLRAGAKPPRPWEGY
jgi:hypothetical protein